MVSPFRRPVVQIQLLGPVGLLFVDGNAGDVGRGHLAVVGAREAHHLVVGLVIAARFVFLPRVTGGTDQHIRPQLDRLGVVGRLG